MIDGLKNENLINDLYKLTIPPMKTKTSIILTILFLSITSITAQTQEELQKLSISDHGLLSRVKFGANQFITIKGV